MAAGLADHIWTCDEIAALLDYATGVASRLDNAPFVPGTPTSAYPTVDDFAVEPVSTGLLGLHMRWTSRSLGVLTDFAWWDDLERSGNRLDEKEWSAAWTADEPYVDADMDWAFMAWFDGGFLYVHSGPAFDELVWYRVPRQEFASAMARFRESVTRALMHARTHR